MRNIGKERTYTTVVQRLRSVGLRPTKQRIALANILFKDGYKHITAEDLHREALGKGITVSLATIYNTLNQFKDVSLIREINVDSSKCYYDSNVLNHHHFYYEKTGVLKDIDEGDLVISSIPKIEEGHKISNIDVVIRIG
jgi:Fur family iron response transcriptional regulator